MGMLLRRNHGNAKPMTDTEQTQRAVENTAPVVEKVEAKKEKPAKKPSRVEIMRMNVATVRAYAEEQGIEGASAMSGAELKRILVNKMFEEE